MQRTPTPSKGILLAVAVATIGVASSVGAACPDDLVELSLLELVRVTELQGRPTLWCAASATMTAPGQFRAVYPDGAVAVEGRLGSHGREGRWSFYFTGGAVAIRGDYRRDRRHSRWQEWTPNGVLVFDATYVDGHQHGPWSTFYGSGAIKQRGTSRRDRSHGRWQQWDENGRLRQDAHYRNGELHGRVVWWTSEGALEQVRCFVRSELKWQSTDPRDRTRRCL